MLALLMSSGCQVAQDDGKHVVLFGAVALFVVVGLPVLYIVSRVRGERHAFRGAVAELGLDQVTDAGLYVSGHPEQASTRGVKVGRRGDEFIFVDDVRGTAAFVIPRSAPSAIDVVDATKVTTQTMQNVTVGRVALLGIYALAFPKTTTTTTTHEKYVVGISWSYNGLALTTCFAFTSAARANAFAGFVAKNKTAHAA